MKKTMQKTAEKNAASYYELHSGAVEDLVNATKENTPRYSREELEKYRSGKTKWKLPPWLKIGLIKCWFYGAVCFFVFWGLDMYFAAAVVLGMVTDLLIRHFLRFTEKLPGGSKRWMMITRGVAVGFIMNLAYGFLLLFLVVTAYQVINTVIFTLYDGSETAPLLNVEPIVFGLAATVRIPCA